MTQQDTTPDTNELPEFEEDFMLEDELEALRVERDEFKDRFIIFGLHRAQYKVFGFQNRKIYKMFIHFSPSR